MAAEQQQPPDGLASTTLPTATSDAMSPELNPLDHDPTTTNEPIGPKVPNNPPKRRRRPSVRLGEIGGDTPLDYHRRRPAKSWRFHKDPSFAAKASKTRPLTNLVNGGDTNFQDFPGPSENFVDFTYRKPKTSKPTKRVRTNWNKFDSTTIVNGGGREGAIIETSNAFQDETDHNDNNEDLGDFDMKGSESPLLKDQSPVNSAENMGIQYWDHQRRGGGGGIRASESNGVLHEEVNSPEQQHNEGSLGVREWLNGLGLGRYAPVFEIHEVDDEVLPMLTLEDLKDMGINAVGSRRKIYSAILKLRK
ncbi:myb-like protein A-like [Dorcoceras hygrometricum]|uniref:Myb-like protein A-like n=1 Tax=Dorcoceras hygrometricum TaxID=472368 RepID=A0A2Z7CL20_9LAMI|nr:myb-like protein A-like [Dorcoceras hygrometricum]